MSNVKYAVASVEINFAPNSTVYVGIPNTGIFSSADLVGPMTYKDFQAMCQIRNRKVGGAMGKRLADLLARGLKDAAVRLCVTLDRVSSPQFTDTTDWGLWTVDAKGKCEYAKEAFENVENLVKATKH